MKCTHSYQSFPDSAYSPPLAALRYLPDNWGPTLKALSTMPLGRCRMDLCTSSPKHSRIRRRAARQAVERFQPGREAHSLQRKPPKHYTLSPHPQ